LGTLTISLDDEVEKKLREVALRLHGARKGSLSNVIESALKNYFNLLDKAVGSGEVLFKAFKGDALVAEAHTLDELAEVLKKKGVEPRGLRIVSSKPIGSSARAGYRIIKA
jgi:hypothetical protein